MTDPDASRAIVQAFEERWRRDRAAGVERDLDAYLKQFPGDTRGVAAAFLALEARTRNEQATDETSIGPYRTMKVLGRGGQGVVYLAEDTRFGRQVALKVLSNVGPLGEEVLARFRREALVASRLNHPGICGVLDAEIEGGVPYIAMPFVSGQTLAQSIQDSRNAIDGGDESSFVSFDADAPTEVDSDPPEEDVETSSSDSIGRKQIEELLRVFEGAARALHAAHEVGVIHRDLKPANLMVTEEGEPVLLDFGLAMADDLDGESLTRTGDLFGTPAYMSPEQLTRGTLRIDRRTDVYSLGAALFEALTLRKPFEAPTRDALYHAILTREASSVRSLNPRVPRDLAVVVARALEKDRERRYGTAEEFAEELRRIRELEPVLARPIGAGTRVARWARRNPVVASLLAVLFTVLTAATVLTAREAGRAERALASQTRALEAEQQQRIEKEAATRERDRALRRIQREATSDQIRRARGEAGELWPISPELEPRLSQWLEDHSGLFDPQLLPRLEVALEDIRAQAIPYTEAMRLDDHRSAYATIEALEERIEDFRGETLPQRLLFPSIRSQLAIRIAALREEIAKRKTWTFTDRALEYRHEELVDLIRELREFTGDSRQSALKSIQQRLKIARQSAPLTVSSPVAAKRWEDAIARIRANPRYRITEEMRGELSEFPSTTRLYDVTGAMNIVPQTGLVPLGPDPRSGLEEFLHLPTHDHDWDQDEIDLPERRDPASARARHGYDVGPDTGVILVLLPPGSFLMGSQNEDPAGPNHDPGHLPDEGPVHRVVLESFFLSKYELTYGQLDRSADIDPVRRLSYQAARIWNPLRRKFLRTRSPPGDYPASAIIGQRHQVARIIGLEIPTEAQWEWGARAGLDSVIWALPAGVNSPEGMANVSGRETRAAVASWERGAGHQDRHVTAAPVGLFPPNPFGLHDMTGNVRELVRGRYESYELTPTGGDGLRQDWGEEWEVDPTLITVQLSRGGSYRTSADGARIALRFPRYGAAETLSSADLGIRPARSITLK